MSPALATAIELRRRAQKAHDTWLVIKKTCSDSTCRVIATSKARADELHDEFTAAYRALTERERADYERIVHGRRRSN